MLDRFGLGDRLKDKLESLSLGNQQRVQIIASLLHGPTALILDEPFSGLDPVAVDSMVDLLRDRLREGVPGAVLQPPARPRRPAVRLPRRALRRQGHGRRHERGAARPAGRAASASPPSPDAGWLREEPGVRVVDVDGPRAVLELDDEAPGTASCSDAVGRGLREFTPLVPDPVRHLPGGHPMSTLTHAPRHASPRRRARAGTGREEPVARGHRPRDDGQAHRPQLPALHRPHRS